MSPAAVLPIPRSLRVEALLLDEAGRTILASSAAADVRCPVCGAPADRVHSRYDLPLADLPGAGPAGRLRVRARRFFCANPSCPRPIFAERLDGIAPAFAPRPDRQRAALAAIAGAAGGEAGARLAAALGDPVGPDTRLRLVRGAGSDAAPAPAVLGGDDRAFRTGRTYGTIPVARARHRPGAPARHRPGAPARHRPGALRPDRTAETLATWLAAHPGGRLVTRDRSGAYAEGIAAGAPRAVRVADRWRLLDTLRAAAQPALERHRARLPACPVPAAAAAVAAAPPPAAPERTPLGSYGRSSPRQERQRPTARTRRRGRYERVAALRERGWTGRRIARAVGLSERPVQRWLAVGHFPERQRRAAARRLLDAYRPYLDRRWAAGCHTVARRCRERRDQGDDGSCALAYGYAACRRSGIPPPETTRPPPETTRPPPAAAPAAPPLAPRAVVWLLLRAAATLAEADRPSLDAVRQADPVLATAVDLTRDFGAMVRSRRADRRDAWLGTASASGIAEFREVAAGLARDKAAVAAAVAERWSPGQTDGQGLRLKLIKRQMHGRAKVDPLRQRALRAA
jgi:transposase